MATADASRRWLAAPVIARRSSPDADLSAMDGFATAGAGPWTVVGESAAGHPWADSISAGEAVRISTGAQLPAGADAILIRENAALDGRILRAASPPSADYIRRTGFDFGDGDTVLAAGVRVGPPQLALALAAGIAELDVGRRPRIAILDTGDELAADPSELRPEMVPATNGPMLAAMCADLVSYTATIGPVRDDLAHLLDALGQADDADVIVISGGASVGEHDLVRPALEAWGAAIDFWRVAIRPGKPLLVARRGAQFIVGLPGNTVSAYVTAVLFVLPLFRRLAGAPVERCLPRRITTVLAAPTPAGGARREFLRARWTEKGLVPIAERDSSAVRSLALADALIDRPASVAPASAGEVVSAILLENGAAA